MDKTQVFETWAPPNNPWSTWAKPIVFAFMDATPEMLPPFSPPNVSWAPLNADRVAIVCDLPAEQGVLVGLALAAIGYRPVPLYNAVPAPSEVSDADYALLDVRPIISAIWHGTEQLLKCTAIDDTSPPVFLLDSRRRGGDRKPEPGQFDNRSICVTTDFPSASFLLRHEIKRALLVQSFGEQPQPDLAHTLRRWQESGIAIELVSLDDPGPSVPIEVQRPSKFGAIWYRALAVLGLRRHELGGFGGELAEGSAG